MPPRDLPKYSLDNLANYTLDDLANYTLDALAATPTLDPVEDITRRRLLTAIPGLTLLAGGISCGDDDDNVDPTAEATGTPAATPTSAPTTRLVNNYFGQTEVPANPERVVVTDNNALPYVLELGLVPVGSGTLDGKTFHEALTGLGAGQVTPFMRDEPDYELVTSLQPDLIVGSSFTLVNRVANGVETYGKLAPLTAVDSDLPVLEQLRAYGRILNREAKAEELIAEFERDIRGLASGLTVKTVSIARAFGDSQVFIYTNTEPFTSVWLNLLGLSTVPDATEASAAGTIIAAAERLGELQGEALIVIFGIERLEQNPLWPLLPAVQAGHVHHVGDYLTYAGNGGLNALREQILGIGAFLGGIR